jgi:cell division protease FtsH
MQKKTRFNITYFLIAFLLLLLLENYFLARNVATIGYGDFKVLLTEGLVQDLEVSTDTIDGKLKDKAHDRLVALWDEKDEKKIQRLKEIKIFRTVRMEDSGLVKELGERRIRYTVRPQSTWFMTLLSWVLPILLFFGLWVFLVRKMGQPGEGLMAIGKSKAKVFVEGETKITFADVAGVEEAEQELVEVIQFLKNPERFQTLGGKIPKGILLVGPPGTGKTLLAKAVAGEAKVPFLSLSGSAFVEMFVGVGAARVRDLFSQAEKLAPCIIFIDEIDALGRARGVGPVAGVDEREQTLTQLLSEMDGFDSKKGVIIMAATNRPEIIDPALLRPGRFDRHVLVDRPDAKGREEIFRVHVRKLKLAPAVDLKALASMTPGMAGADIANVANEAALLAARKSKEMVEMADFEEAIERIIAGLEKKSRVLNKQERERVAYHECGHAVVASVLPHADPVKRVSIIPRGIAALGYTLQTPTEDRYLLTRSELLDRIAVMLGGRAAEEIVFNEVSTGAKNDLDKATDLAANMVRSYGMSEKLGPLSYDRGGPAFLNVPGAAREKDYSEETARTIDAEVRAIVEKAYATARSIITERRDAIMKIAAILLQKEVIEGEELKALLRQYSGLQA